MLNRTLALALLTGSVLAQANAVPGLDIRMYDVLDAAFMGRRGAAFPNGEAGFAIGHSWCNGGTVNLPWLSVNGNGQMVDSYPRIAFLLARDSGGRMVQVSGQSFCKHSPTAFNFSSGPCAPCNAAGGGFFFVGCSDTYGSGTNGGQDALGPTTEIDPWLGTWNPIGSYFDRGDPPVSGAAATDGVRSLNTSGFDSVKNRMIVRESELIAGASYYGQTYAMVQGEPVAARSNNAASRQISISGSGGNWNAATVGTSVIGPVLSQWPGATWHTGGNGNDDGRFVVAVKVTGPVAGMWHYEYAIQNLDNNRGGASFRIPVATGATVQNAGFRDIDANPLNDWAFARTANEITFQATAGNSLDWNTIYNCWFDCSVQPGAGSMTIDEARIGAGALSVQVQADVPSGLSYATKATVGTSCGLCQGSVYEYFTTSTSFDLAGRSMTLTNNGNAYTVTGAPVAFVPVAGINLGLGLSTQAPVTLPFTLPYPGGSTTTLQVFSPGYVTPGIVGPVQLLPSPANLLNGPARWAAAWSLYQPIATSANNVYYDATPARAILTWSGVPMVGSTAPNTFQIQFFPDGTVNMVWQTIAPSSFQAMVGWSPGGGHRDPGTRDLSATLGTPLVLCGPSFDGIALDANAPPVLGSTMQWQINGIQAGTAWGALFRSVQQATPPIDLTAIGMPGCFQHVLAPVATLFNAPGTSVQLAETIPNAVALVGVNFVGQAVAYSPPLTALGLVASNGVAMTLGL